MLEDPTRAPLTSEPSVSVTMICSASLTTCSFVRIYPSWLMMRPDPRFEYRSRYISGMGRLRKYLWKK
jgi:hypothetical protein